MCLCTRMLALKWKERAFLEKLNTRYFCWFLAAILVWENLTHIWRLHTKHYNGAWNVSANNSETVGHIDLRLGQMYITLLQSFIFLSSSTGLVSNFFLCHVYCVTVKTIYSYYLKRNDVTLTTSYFTQWEIIGVNCISLTQIKNINLFKIQFASNWSYCFGTWKQSALG